MAPPPPRERLDGVGVLAGATPVRLASRTGFSTMPRLSSVGPGYRQCNGVPGNGRELENILERALASSNGEVIDVEGPGLRPATLEAQPTGHALERHAIVRALERRRHDRTAAARRLGIGLRALRGRMQRLGIR